MKRENLERMTDEELEGYAQALGFTAKGAKGRDGVLRLIEKRRERTADISVLGVDLSVKVKGAHDRRVSELLNKDGRTDADVFEAFRLMLGDGQLQALVDAATDDDGTVDEPALSFAFSSILGSQDLKNF